jgi:RNA polymerase sigma factor (sigma-70 family)
MKLRPLGDSLVIGMLNGDQKSAEDLHEVIFGNCLWHLKHQWQIPIEYAEDAAEETKLAIWEQQEFLLELWKKRNDPETKSRPGQYATSINRNKIVDALREWKRARRGTELSPDESENEMDDARFFEQSINLIQNEELNDRRRLWVDICEIGNAASGAFRNGWIALLSNHFGGLSYAEIAEIMGARESTVKSWARRFRKLYLPQELKRRGWTSTAIREARGF